MTDIDIWIRNAELANVGKVVSLTISFLRRIVIDLPSCLTSVVLSQPIQVRVYNGENVT